MLRLPVGVMEAGLLTMKAGLRSMQSSVETLTGHRTSLRLHEPPVHGPQDIDFAISDFVNQAVRIGRLTRPEASEIAESVRRIVETARASFAFVDLRDPRNLTLPIEATLSAGTLITEVALRAMAAFTVLGPKRIPAFVDNTVEMFSEVGMFVSLQYQTIIKRHRDRLERVPGDDVTRLELGRTYVKCGLYDHAVKELEIAARNPSARGLALHECAVAHYRAGRFEQAVKTGVAALEADPHNERARAVLWLASRSTNGYPDYVPADFRIDIKTGYEPSRLRYQDVSDKIGLDKTSAGRGTAIFDYNNDGLLDVVIAAAHGGANLYRNNGDGTFTDVSIESGLDRCVNGFAVTAGDYDNDGNTDLFVTRLGFYGGEGTLFHNNGDGTFTDVTEKAGLKCWGPAFTACWVDYDCDGWLDLFIANNLGGIFDRHIPNRLFHNNGDGTFTEVTEQAGLSALGPTIGACW
ncbi:MAG TPA: FG-GAP-like repeat-containing protein, partial [Mycobacterium sp.]|nr:FG-GAP-like repeat-containing protein [Mycobacterium sp.]